MGQGVTNCIRVSDRPRKYRHTVERFWSTEVADQADGVEKRPGKSHNRKFHSRGKAFAWRQAAEGAGWQSKFSPTILSEQAVALPQNSEISLGHSQYRER